MWVSFPVNLSRDTEDGFEIVTVQSGACSVRSRRFGETFHPVVGPMQEAKKLHVVQQRLVDRAERTASPFVIWDVGLGAGANAIAALSELRRHEGAVEVHSFDFDSQALAFALENEDELQYFGGWEAAARRLIAERSVKIGEARWYLHEGDFRETMGGPPAPHAIFYDPYSLQSNPEMFALEHFVRMRGCLNEAAPCLLTNYTRSTAVRVTLLLAGFCVGRGEATGEKEETTIASNDLSLLERPLDRDWLERVKRSTNGAPLRDARQGSAPISGDDAAALAALPQFA